MTRSDSSAAAEDPIRVRIGPDHAGQRLDKALAALVPDLSRARIGQLIAAGAVTGPDEAIITATRTPAIAGGLYILRAPSPEPTDIVPEPIPLDILFEDADLLVIDKPAGMVVHPAPGNPSGTLVNALLHHCGNGLLGIGGTARPGIVHRIDKDTSGILVVAKSQAAHVGLADQFAAHTAEREYRAVTTGAPDLGDPRMMGLPGVSSQEGAIRIETGLARHPTDRKRMAVSNRDDARRAVSHFRVLERYGTGARPAAGLISCRLETGRTHQIRVHARHLGHALAGDPVYGRKTPMAATALDPAAAAAVVAFPRQALHAVRLGFCHPITGVDHMFESPLPSDFRTLVENLRRNPFTIR